MRPILIVDERPLRPGGETCPTPAAQPGSFDHIDDLVRLHRLDHFFKGLKPTVLAVDLQLIEIGYFSMA
jgi:hypothetical protein